MAGGNSNFDSVACSFKIRTPLPPVFFAIEIENLAVMNSRSPIRADSDMWIYCSVLETSANEAVTIKFPLYHHLCGLPKQTESLFAITLILILCGSKFNSISQGFHL